MGGLRNHPLLQVHALPLQSLGFRVVSTKYCRWSEHKGTDEYNTVNLATLCMRQGRAGCCRLS